MWISVLVKVPGTFVKLALHVQDVFSNHPLGSGHSSLSRTDLLGPCGAAETFSPDSSDRHDFGSGPQQARTGPGDVAGPEVLGGCGGGARGHGPFS